MPISSPSYPFPASAKSARVLQANHRSSRPFHDWNLTIWRSEEHTSELQSLMRISYAVFCLKQKKDNKTRKYTTEAISSSGLQFTPANTKKLHDTQNQLNNNDTKTVK